MEQKKELLKNHIEGFFFFQFIPSIKNNTAETIVTIVNNQNDPSIDVPIKR